MMVYGLVGFMSYMPFFTNTLLVGFDQQENNNQITIICIYVQGIKNNLNLSAENINDNTLAIEVLMHVELFGSKVLEDNAYGTAAIRKYITSKDVTYTIPSKTNA